VTKSNEKLMVLVSAETLCDLHLAAYDHDYKKYPVAGEDIMAAQEEARTALYACGWWGNADTSQENTDA
jgi:hypothetical protein